MSGNFAEELISEYFRLKGFMVVSNYWFPVDSNRDRVQKGKKQQYSARSWSDIDVLAIGENEIFLIQVKAIVNSRNVVRKVEEFFKNAVSFIRVGKAPDGTGSISWWCKDREIKKLLIYETYSPPVYLEQLKKNDIEVKKFTEYFEEIIGYVKKKEGVKEGSALMRMMHYLKRENRLQ